MPGRQGYSLSLPASQGREKNGSPTELAGLIREILNLSVSRLDGEEAFKRLATLIRRLIDCDWVSVCIHRQDADCIELYAIAADGPLIFRPGATLHTDGSAQMEAIRTGRPVLWDNNVSEVHAPELLFTEGADLHSALLVPLISNGQNRGTLDLARKKEGGFSQREIDLAEQIALAVAIFVEQARQLNEKKEFGRIEERSRLAREIHDTVVQNLISVILHLELAEGQLRTDVPAALMEIKRAYGLARHSLEEARRAVLDLPPLSLELASLDQAVAREVKGLRGQGIDARFSLVGLPTALDSESEVALYRIVQEILANVRKHAQASQVTAVLEYGPETVMLTVSDNGIGFEADGLRQGPSPKGCFGLAGARQRAALLGGDLVIESALGRGTKVMARIPTAARPPATAPDAVPAAEAASSSRIRVLIIEDHEVTRRGIRDVLKEYADIEIVGEAGDGEEGLEKTRSLRPDIALLDMRIQGVSGIDLLTAMKEEGLSTRCLILTAYRSGDLVVDAIRAGAHAYLLKDAPSTDLVAAIRAVQRGEILLGAAVGGDLVQRMNGLDTVMPEALTTRELQVLSLIAKGFQNKEIARELSLTEATVKYHVAHLLEKLGVGNRTEALSKALELGLIAKM